MGISWSLGGGGKGICALASLSSVFVKRGKERRGLRFGWGRGERKKVKQLCWKSMVRSMSSSLSLSSSNAVSKSLSPWMGQSLPSSVGNIVHKG